MTEEVVSVAIQGTGDVLTFTAEYEAVDAVSIRGRLHFIEGGRAEYLLHSDAAKHLWLNGDRDCYELTVDPLGDTFIGRRINLRNPLHRASS
jgi:hypothetical protein